MSRYSYDFNSDAYISDEYYPRKSSATQTFYEYNGCYPEGHELADELPLISTDVI